MDYRIEFDFIGAEGSGHGSREFEAQTDEEALSRINDLCLERQTEFNNGQSNPYWHVRVEPTRLVRIQQHEIGTEIAAFRNPPIIDRCLGYAP